MWKDHNLKWYNNYSSISHHFLRHTCTCIAKCCSVKLLRSFIHDTLNPQVQPWAISLSILHAFNNLAYIRTPTYMGHWPSMPSQWLDIDQVLFFACLWTEMELRSINSWKKKQDNNPTNLTVHAWSKKDLLCTYQCLAPIQGIYGLLTRKPCSYQGKFDLFWPGHPQGSGLLTSLIKVDWACYYPLIAHSHGPKEKGNKPWIKEKIEQQIYYCLMLVEIENDI